MQHTYISLPLFCMSKACNLLVTRIYFMEELAYVFSKNFVASVSVHFSVPLIFTSRLWNFHQQNFSSLFSSTCSSSFSVIHMSVDIKNNVKKDSTLLFFLSKSPGGHVISCQKTPLSCIWVAIPVDWVILHECACGALVRVGERMVMWLGNQIFLPKCQGFH